ncbi:class I SAM-dependent DNA methyltransferase [Rathayibacter soli]|uniref:class I SAM-dependent DNA methyltransferase n=1 Tax=Rathayibacter soli TaxID=3144168 RepID=UPI0027E54174|nr:class I SAM-dependent methyltransferase [Glaciibacter superstes]
MADLTSGLSPDLPFLSETRTSYDTVAADYAELLADELAAKPLDRALLTAFAELVGAGPVADLGCGPGRITAYLHGLGLDVFGVDLSPGMLAEAGRRHPELRFEEGSLLALDSADASLAGIVAWYSIIHTPLELLPKVFAEFHRTLAGGGQLLLAFQAGDEMVRLTQAYGHEVALDAYRLPPDGITELLVEAGFTVHARVLREPGAGEKTPQAYLMAQS